METLDHRENSSKPVPEPPDFASGGVSGPLLNHFLCVFGTTNDTFFSFLQGSPPWILENPVAKRVTFSTISSGKWTSDPVSGPESGQTLRNGPRNRSGPPETVPGDRSGGGFGGFWVDFSTISSGNGKSPRNPTFGPKITKKVTKITFFDDFWQKSVKNHVF